uniref:RHS repeat-associated core domain-containing protein n=1 Tax=Flavobacterium sp. TaxID=239 RepID=UPI00260D9D08
EGGPLGITQGSVEYAQAPGKFKYKYNGQEWQGDFGYDMYDMPLRDYDPAIARWVVLDPVIHHSQSPYSAFNGNPIVFADPSGGAGRQMLDNNGAEMYDSNGNFIRRSDRVVPGETSKFTQAGAGSNTTDTADDVKENTGLIIISTVEELAAFLRSNPNISPEDLKPKDDPQQEGKNAELARYIANKYGYDRKEVEEFLDKNPFTLTKNGVAFAGYEALSTKVKKEIIDKAAEKTTTSGFKFLMTKVLGTSTRFVLNITELGDPNSESARSARIVDCQMRLIELVFRKPVENMPLPRTGIQHSSIYDKKHLRYY